ncbi:MAG: hypothetical protein H8E46_02975 [FCB group bacterium]|nr:hypothetical protein [FCB group bacterium]
MLKNLSKNSFLLIFLTGLVVFLPFKTADAVWQSLIWENFGDNWADWPWSKAGNPWVVLPTG